MFKIIFHSNKKSDLHIVSRGTYFIRMILISKSTGRQILILICIG